MTRIYLLRKALSGLLILTLAGCHPGKEKTQEKCQTLQIETETAAGSIRLSEVANGSLVGQPTSDSLLLNPPPGNRTGRICKRKRFSDRRRTCVGIEPQHAMHKQLFMGQQLYQPHQFGPLDGKHLSDRQQYPIHLYRQ